MGTAINLNLASAVAGGRSFNFVFWKDMILRNVYWCDRGRVQPVFFWGIESWFLYERSTLGLI